MRKKILWVAAALALIATPALIGLIALRGDDESSSSARRQAALIDAAKGSADDGLELAGITPLGKAIAVESFSWGVANTGGAVTTGGTRTAGKANFADFTFMKHVDETSTKLMLQAANGKHIPTATLTVRKSGADAPATLMIYKFSEVLISSVQQSKGGEPGYPAESVTFNYAKVDVTVNRQNPDGTIAKAGQMNWDIMTNTGA